MKIKVGDILELSRVYFEPVMVRVTEVGSHQIRYTWVDSDTQGYFYLNSPLARLARIMGRRV